MHALNISSPDREGVLQVSKSRKLPVLLNYEEIKSLIAHLGEFCIFDVSRPLSLDSAEIPKSEFLRAYRDYIETIERGDMIEESSLLPYFSSIWTLFPEGVYAQKLPNGKFLIKTKIPAIQLQRHHFIFTDQFHSGVMGSESITWGIQFSYPHLFMDPKSKAIGKVEKSAQFPNTDLFQRLAKWVRSHTRPTPFVVREKISNQPMRLGKGCFGFINNHPQLKEKNLYVQSPNDS